ncbi:MAG: hypothetical protein MJ066_05190 [Clostridia bacterium]|nr:hypothetical protein [Clostridia bacterium]
MNEELIKELEARLIFLIGGPRKEPGAKTPEEWAEAERIMDELEKLKKVKLVRAEKYFLPVSKLAKNAVKLVNGDLGDPGKLEVDQRKKINVFVSVGMYDHDESLILPKKYNLYLDAVQMTIGSLTDSNAQYFTAEQVYRTMNGIPTEVYISPQAVEATTTAINQLRNLWVTIDRSEELKAYKKLKGLSIIQKKSILPFNSTITIKNQAGRQITAYKLEELPPLYQYSKDRGEIHSLPIELMNIKGLRTSAQNTALKIWLLQQIESMKPGKTGKRRDSTIKINTLFEALKYDIIFNSSSPRADKAKYIKQIKTMLDSWTDQKYIKGYKENKKGRSLESITIIL